MPAKSATSNAGPERTPVNLTPKLEKILNVKLNGKSDAYLQMSKGLVERRKDVVDQLMKDKEITQRYPSLELLKARLDGIQEALDQKANVKEQVKQGWGRWALEKAWNVVTYPARHPVKAVMIALAIAAIAAGGVAAAAYFAGGWEQLLTLIGWEKMFGAGSIATASETLGKLFHGTSKIGADLMQKATTAAQEGIMQ